MKKSNLGFTLFELLVSISIIAILTALAIVSFSSAQKSARDARRAQDMEALSKAAEQYYSLNSASYPTTLSVGTSWAGVLVSVPIDPKYGIGYTNSMSASSYCICAYMEGQKGNSLNASCSFMGVGGTGTYYCVKNQQ